jgi:hypothetical protein
MKNINLFFLFLFMPSLIFPHQIKLSLDLEIREPEGIIFNRFEDIATDSKNNIYILDRGEKLVYLFDEEGKFQKIIGRPGQGPGEFRRPISIYIDTKDTIYVLDSLNRRIEIFDSESDYIRSVKIVYFPIGSGKRIIVDKNGNFYISGYFRSSNSVISKFSSTGVLLKHFSLPVIEYNGVKFSEPVKSSVMQDLSGGSMCFDDKEQIFFSYGWPYLIKILTKEGNELFQFPRKHNYNWIPLIFERDDSGYISGESTRTCKIFFLNSIYLINSFFVVDWEGNPKRKVNWSILIKNPKEYFSIKRRFAVLDFYTKEKEFIASTEIDEKLYFLASDKKGRILAVKKDEEDVPTIVRYTVEIAKDR